MNYIMAEQFLLLPKKVQKVFIDWWKIKEGDLIYLVDEKETQIIIKEEIDIFDLHHHWYYDNDSEELMMTCKSYDDGYPTIPLFRLDQLWDFMEIRYPHIGVNNFIFKDEYGVKLFKSMMRFEPNIEVIEKGKLQAFWKAAVIVAEEILKEQLENE